MKILALETSAKSVSAAVTDGGVVRAYTYQNTGLTHSRTLMPLVDAMLRESEQSLSDMDLLAVAAGPGSFTGLRIGVSALKGLAWAADKPCCGVSTLEAMAQNLRHMDGLIVCAMDARRNQVYNAVFSTEGGQLTRLTPDRAIALSQLAEELLIECNEGELCWVDKKIVPELPTWEGDKVFLNLLLSEEKRFFSVKLQYEGAAAPPGRMRRISFCFL